MFCSKCGKQIDDEALICPACGCATANYVKDKAEAEARATIQVMPAQPLKKRSVALALCIFFGGLGAHRFYVGKIGTGILWLLTLGLCGIGTIIDLVCIIMDSFTDDAGRQLYDPRKEGMTDEEYDEATKAPRMVRAIVLAVLAFLVVLWFIYNLLF